MKPFNPSDFWLLVTGSDDWTSFWAGVAMAVFANILSMAIRIRHGIKTNPNTPNQFRWRYFSADNIDRFIIGLACTFATMRFSAELTGSEVTVWLSFIYGLLNYRLGSVLLQRADLVLDAMNAGIEKIKKIFH